jgi:lipoprotein-releasing system permease protein
MYEYDSKFAYIDLGEAQRLFGAGDSVSWLEVKVKDVDAARPVMRRVLTALDGYPYRVKDWGELNRNLFSALQMEKVVMAVILGFIVLVASFIIVATLIMLVLEKRREVAVLKSMGAGLPSIMKIFVAEGLVIGAVGTLFGLLLGFGTCLFIDKVGIPLDPEVYYISNLPVLVEPWQFALVALLAVFLSYLATVYPAAKAARLDPVEGLRSE